MTGKDVVLITGASSGLGAQFCRALAAAGYTIVAAARRGEKLDALCAEITKTGGEAHSLLMDVTDFDGIADAIDKAEEKAGPIACLVNNAGSSVSKKAVDMTPDDFDFVVDLNLKAPYFVATEMARRWIARGAKGRIVNVGSVSDRRATPGHTVYGTTKAGIARMTEQLAREWITTGINVNALAPGYIRTELNSDFFDTPKGEAMIAGMPRRRIGAPDVLDKAIVYLCQADQDYLTGQILALDDGMTL